MYEKSWAIVNIEYSKDLKLVMKLLKLLKLMKLFKLMKLLKLL